MQSSINRKSQIVLWMRRTVALLAFSVMIVTGAITSATASPNAQTPRVLQAPATDSARSAKPAKTAKRKKVLSGKLNINTATAKQLEMLPGVGAAKAERIVAYRNKRGKFARVRDLRRVKGIGAKSLAKWQSYLSVSGETTLKFE